MVRNLRRGEGIAKGNTDIDDLPFERAFPAMPRAKDEIENLFVALTHL